MDLISRQAAIDTVKEFQHGAAEWRDEQEAYSDIWHRADSAISSAIAIGIKIKEIPSAQPEQRWIPCSSGNLPQTTDPVNITWVNRDPPSYYSHIKDVPYTATGHYHKGKWWWYSASCQDYLDEYGESEVDRMDDRIEVIAWQPLPEPYKET